jgi:3-hydroxyacyl-CoA dehydrogenase/enoyl-CoA hydratase/3-hydroxybutyryl-CoA epimerase
LYSLKKNNFIAGADVNMILTIEDPEQGKKIAWDGHQLLFRFENLRIPTLSAIHGSCLGGGLEVALSTSHRLASEHRATQLGLPEVKLGLIPGCGGTQRLPRLIGLSNAIPLILSGSSVSAQKAKDLGLVDKTIPYDNEKSFFGKMQEYALELQFCNFKPKYQRRSRSLKEYVLDHNFIGIDTA